MEAYSAFARPQVKNAPHQHYKVVSLVDEGLGFLLSVGVDSAPLIRVEMAVEAPFKEKR